MTQNTTFVSPENAACPKSQSYLFRPSRYQVTHKIREPHAPSRVAFGAAPNTTLSAYLPNCSARNASWFPATFRGSAFHLFSPLPSVQISAGDFRRVSRLDVRKIVSGSFYFEALFIAFSRSYTLLHDNKMWGEGGARNAMVCSFRFQIPPTAIPFLFASIRGSLFLLASSVCSAVRFTALSWCYPISNPFSFASVGVHSRFNSESFVHSLLPWFRSAFPSPIRIGTPSRLPLFAKTPRSFAKFSRCSPKFAKIHQNSPNSHGGEGGIQPQLVESERRSGRFGCSRHVSAAEVSGI
jgi:hypothetical protein